MYFKRLLFCSILITLVFISCSKNVSSMKDGYYTAQMTDYDSFGWKEYLTVRVFGGKVIHIEYDAANQSGLIRSWDMDYMRYMNSISGIYPNAFTRFYEGELLQKQSVGRIDHLSGATVSYYSFLKLAEAVLDNAFLGETKISLVPRPDMEGLINNPALREEENK